jgi:hypothetical protein
MVIVTLPAFWQLNNVPMYAQYSSEYECKCGNRLKVFDGLQSIKLLLRPITNETVINDHLVGMSSLLVWRSWKARRIENVNASEGNNPHGKNAQKQSKYGLAKFHKRNAA